jgi:hypothetical protein
VYFLDSKFSADLIRESAQATGAADTETATPADLAASRESVVRELLWSVDAKLL